MRILQRLALNARTGKENDSITDESGKFIPGGDIPPPPNLTERRNFDNSHNIVNDHGKQLLDLCKTCDLRILNSRSKGDTLGKFTFHSINGISTVDYIIVSHVLFTSVQGFAVKQPNIFSDHSQIVCWIKTGTNLSNNNNSFPEKNNVQQHHNSMSGTKRLQQNSLLPFVPTIFCLYYIFSKV